MYDDNDYLNTVNHNERSLTKSHQNKSHSKPPADDDLDRDVTYNDTYLALGTKDRSFVQDSKNSSFQKSKSPLLDKPKSTGHLHRKMEDEQKTFKLTLKQTLPKPQDTSEEDKQYLLPKIENQNVKLRDQVQDLLDLLESQSLQIFSKKTEKFKPQKYEPDEQLKSRDKVLYDKLQQIRYYQREIKDLRKQLQDSYNVERLIELENDIKNKQLRIQTLRDEEVALKRVEDEQSQALVQINREGDYDQKIQEMSDQLRQFKKQYREVYYEQMENDKNLIDRHEEVVKMDKRVKKMQKQLKEKMGDKGHSKDSRDNGDRKVTKDLLTKLREEINDCKQQRLQEEKSIKMKLQDQEMEIESLEHDMKILELQVKEKEQESRLADLKIKELKRTLKHKTLKPLTNSPPIIQKAKDGKIRYQSQSEIQGQKILRKKLENGRITYQDVVLTEENVKLHEQKYQLQSKRYYDQADPKHEEQQAAQVKVTPKETQQVKGNQPKTVQDVIKANQGQQQDLQPKRLGPSPSQGALQMNSNNQDLKKSVIKIEKQDSQDNFGKDSARQQSGVFSKPSLMGKKRP